MLVDTHAHLFWDSYAKDLPEVLERAKEAGVGKIIVPGTDIESSRQAVELVKKYPGILYAAVGIHPEEMEIKPKSQILNSKQITNIKSQIEKLESLIKENRESIVGIGEVGIDMYTEEMRERVPDQKKLFRAQCELAIKYDLPLNIHTRQSMGEALKVLDSLEMMPRGEFHCFSGDESELEQALARGFYISFCGNISWSKRVRRLIKMVPGDRLLLDTDSPFMTPVDESGEKVGKRNEPGNVKITAQIAAREVGVNLEEIERQTSENARELYKV